MKDRLSFLLLGGSLLLLSICAAGAGAGASPGSGVEPAEDGAAEAEESRFPSRAELWLDSVLPKRCPLSTPGSFHPGYPFDLARITFPCGRGASRRNLTDWTAGVVNIMSASALVHFIHRNTSEGDWCLVVNFYSNNCPFSARMAPAYNALPRQFPRLYVAAVDASKYSKLNNRYGIAGTPTLLLWQNGRAFARYDESKPGSLASLTKFVTDWTDLVPSSAEVSEGDGEGPLPSVYEAGTDVYLVVSWLFVGITAVYYGSKTATAARIWDLLRRTWLEANETSSAEMSREGSGADLVEQDAVAPAPPPPPPPHPPEIHQQ